MKKIYTLITIAIAVAAIFYAAYYYRVQAPSVSNQTQATDMSQSDLAVYKNDQFGFEISYPNYLIPEFIFKTFYTLSDKWRAEIYTENPKGIPIISIPVYRLENRTAYPRYYSAEIRIGVSSDSQDVSNCLLSDPYNSATSSDEVINELVFKKFPIQNAAMMQYIKGFSYRIVHNNMCFAVEQLAAGSNYRDQVNSDDISESILNGYFDKAREIIKTFQFTK